MPSKGTGKADQLRAQREAQYADLRNHEQTVIVRPAPTKEVTTMGATETEAPAEAPKRTRTPELSKAEAEAQRDANRAGYNAYWQARKAKQAAEQEGNTAEASKQDGIMQANREAYTMFRRAARVLQQPRKPKAEAGAAA